MSTMLLPYMNVGAGQAEAGRIERLHVTRAETGDKTRFGQGMKGDIKAAGLVLKCMEQIKCFKYFTRNFQTGV